MFLCSSEARLVWKSVANICYAVRMIAVERRSEADVSQAGLAIARRFIQRWDIHACQLDDGRYICVHEPLTTSLIFAHLRGEITLGTYLLNRDSEAHFIVLDADNDQSFENLSTLARKLAGEGIPGYLETSRRGGHLWFFFEEAVAGEEARRFGKAIINTHELENIELYPRQDRLGDGPGSLIRLPFGVHRKSGKRYGFHAPDMKPLAPTLRQQALLIGGAHTVSNMVLAAHQNDSKGSVVEKPPTVNVSNSGMLSEQIKRSMTVLEFVSQYVQLSPDGAGKCPFHDDEHPSFSVNDKGNYWHCFAGCGGGSIIDFWMKWREKQGLNSTFQSVVHDLTGHS
jgi:hypothetical protein